MSNDIVAFSPELIVNSIDYSALTFGYDRILILGVGGGCDIVGAYAIASVLQINNPESRIEYGLCVSEKDNYEGFDRLSTNLYRRSTDNIGNSIGHLHSSLKLMLQMKEFDANLPNPFSCQVSPFFR